MATKRLFSLDIIRSIAIVLVVLLHTSSYILLGESRPYLFCRALGILGVPLFVMLTGYLMVDRVYDHLYLPRYLRRNVLPLVVAFEIWNVLLGIVQVITGQQEAFFLWHTAATALLVDSTSLGLLWYLPMTIALYLGMPLVSRVMAWASEFRRRLVPIFCAVLYFGSVVPTAAVIANLAGWHFVPTPLFDLKVFGASVWGGSVWGLYLLLGWCSRRHYFNCIPTPVLLSATPLAFAAFAILGGGKMGTGELYQFLPVVVIATMLFELVRRAEGAIPSWLKHLAGIVSKYSFGVYVLHMPILWTVEASGLLSRAGMAHGLEGSFTELVLLVGTMFLAILGTSVLSKVMPIRRWALLIK